MTSLLTSIATVSLSGTLETKLRAVADAGFDGVEIFDSDLLAYPGSPAEVRQLIADLGLRCTLFQPFRDFEGLTGDLRRRAFDRAEQKFDVMQELGADLLLVCSSVARETLPDQCRIVDDFRELGDRAQRRGVRIGYEALAWGRHVHDHRQAWDIVRQVNHPSVGLILDSFHSLVRRIPINSIGEIDPGKIFIVQLADAPWLDMDYLSWSRHFRNMPGQGDIPVRAFVSELLRIGYRGPLSLEIFNDQFRTIPASTVAVDGVRALRLSIDEGARAVGVILPSTMPPRVQCRGVEFIEFALTFEEAAKLESMLSALGFELTARHRSKDVMRWQQGRINLILNCDPEGLAHSHNLTHGPSVCAIGLRVADVTAATARAEGLSIQSFVGRVGRGEMKMPALRDPGGSLIYLIEDGSEHQVWERDFHSAPASSGKSDSGLTGVDHIAYAMSESDIASWVLYYFALFDVAKKPFVEVADTLGLVQSQPLESHDRALRLLLSGSSSSQTLSARLQRRYGGPGVQYISLATRDIFETAERLHSAGVEFLTVPRNYYRDIEARLGLAAKQVERMAKFNILIDRSNSGDYYQLNTRAFDKRFYFEIVQRSGYDEYGAANEIIRLAAQSRFKDASSTSEME